MKRVWILLTSVVFPWMMQAASMEDVSYVISKGEVIIGKCSVEAKGELVIPDELDGCPVTMIADGAFSYCDALTSIRLPKGLKRIGLDVFRETPNLPVDEAGFQYESEEKRVLLRAPRLLQGHYTLSESVQFIGEHAFGDCRALTSVTLPKQLLGIGGFAFEKCETLEKIEVPETVQSIGLYAFSGCRALRFARLPQDLQILSDKVFANCEQLEEVILPKQLQELRLCFFENCGSLKKITLPETLQVIRRGAFKNCAALETLALPKGLKEIHAEAFLNCEALSFSTFPTQLEWLGEEALYCYKRFVDVDGAEYESPDKVILFKAPQEMEGKAFEIPASVRFICGAFTLCETLETITIPQGVIGIQDEAFAYCSNLRSVIFPDSLKVIGDWAFNGCSSLSSVVIPENVNVIGEMAFQECSKLERVTILGGNVDIQWNAFTETPLKEVYFGNRPPQANWSALGDIFPKPTDKHGIKGYYTAEYERYWKQVMTPRQTWKSFRMELLSTPQSRQ